LLKLIAAIILTSLSVVAVFTALPLPFVAPLSPGMGTITVWTWGQGWQFGLYNQDLQLPVALLAGLALGAPLGGLSQLIYLALGLSGLGTFSQGGGWQYWQQPTMGYLLGLVAAACVTALLAGRSRSLPRLALACLAGIVALHAVGLPYSGWVLWPEGGARLQQLFYTYVVIPLPGQVILAILLATLATVARQTVGRLPAFRG
jgi:biotin transport system substrate-specific component